MILDSINGLISKYFYVISRERLFRRSSQGGVERICAKHIDLKPEMIVLNNEPHGFKKISEDRLSLESFPIYLELEFEEDEFGDPGLVSLDLYAELAMPTTKRLAELSYLAKLYGGMVSLERLSRFNDPSGESLVITSKVSEFFVNHSIEDELRDGAMTPSELDANLETYFTAFSGFIDVLDALILKGRTLTTIDQLFENL